LAGALRDGRGIKLVGETSFGKGTVQQLEPLKDGSSMKITIAEWVTPNGTIIQDNGLKPDFEVELTEDDFKNKLDPQLDKAIELIKEEIKK
jgi:carboxyl-terminal processing protease